MKQCFILPQTSTRSGHREYTDLRINVHKNASLKKKEKKNRKKKRPVWSRNLDKSVITENKMKENSNVISIMLNFKTVYDSYFLYTNVARFTFIQCSRFILKVEEEKTLHMCCCPAVFSFTHIIHWLYMIVVWAIHTICC